MRKNEVTSSQNGRHMEQLAISCKETVSNNTKEHIK